jgi:ABC-type sugar transport system substrate-binding protein
MNKRLGGIAIAVAAVAATAGFLANASSGAPKAQRTIGLILEGPGNPIAPEVEKGGQAAAAALGDTLAITVTDDASSTIDSLIAQHAAAIAVDNEQNSYDVEQALARARQAGIRTLSFEQRYAGTTWVSQSSPTEYARALADALASQMTDRGTFIIVPCRPAEDIVSTWLHAAKKYIRHRYPHMRRVGVVYGGTGNGVRGTLPLRPLLRKHPHLRGLLFLCPSESYTGPPQLVQAHKVGKVFSAGNGADCPPLYLAYADSVLAGAAEMVCSGDPSNYGYLTIWAADHLARGGTFAPGSYDVGGPVGTVRYYSANQELRLGQPLTITKANLAQYAEPDLTLSPGTYKGTLADDPAKQYSYDFGGAAHASQTFTVTNDTPGTSGQLGVAGGDPNFVLQNDTCSGVKLGPDGTCTFAVAYTAPSGCTPGGSVGPAVVAISGGDPSLPHDDIDLSVGGRCP